MLNKDNNVLVSVVIPIYNAAKYLERCLGSLCNQTLEDIEIICIDDGSKDNSADIIRKFECKYKFVKAYYIENNGAAHARNLGLSVATGEYVIFLDADDYFYKSFLEKMYKAAVKEEVDIVLCRCEGYDVSSDSKINMDWTVKRDLMPHGDKFSWRDNTENLFTFCIGWAWDKLYRREFLNTVNLQFQSLRTSNDAYFVFTSLYKASSIYFLDERLILQTRNLKSSLSQTRDVSWECFYEAIKAIKEDMIAYGVYNDLEKSFMNWCVQFIVWNYTTLSEETKQKLLNKIKNEIEPYLNICDHGLTFFRDRTKFLQYATLVAENEVDKVDESIQKIDTNRSPRLFLWGSCVTREIFNLPNNYILAGYLFKNPIHTVFSNRLFQSDMSVDEFESSSSFLRRQTAYDFNKSAEAYLKTHPADYLVLDFADLRLHYFEIINWTGENSRIAIHETSEDSLNKLVSSGLIKQEGIKKNSVFSISDVEWIELLDKFIKLILKYYPEDRIILNQTVFHEKYVNDGKLIDFDPSRAKEAKTLVGKIESSFMEKVPNCKFIPTPENSYADADNYLGLFELHSCRTHYEYKLSAVDGLVKKKFSKDDISQLCDYFDERLLLELNDIENQKTKKVRRVPLCIWGSGISKDVFFNIDKRFEIKEYIFQNPFHTAMTAPLSVNLSNLFSENDFVRKSIEREFKKNVKDYLEKAKAEYLIIDLYDLRLNFYEYHNNDGAVSRIVKTNNTEKCVKKLIQTGDIDSDNLRVCSINDLNDEAWERIISAAVDAIKEVYDDEQIIINQVRFADYYCDEYGDFNKFAQSQSDALRNFIVKRESELIKLLPNAHVIAIPEHVYADVNHRNGLKNINYCTKIYKYQQEAVYGIATQGFSQSDLSMLCDKYDAELAEEIHKYEDFADLSEVIAEKEKTTGVKRRRLNELREELPQSDAYRYGKMFFYPLYLIAKVSDYRKSFGIKQLLIRLIGGRDKALQYQKKKKNNKK